MIALGNNIYRTLDDKFYLGNTQVGKVYLGNTLIYPETMSPQPIEPDRPVVNPPSFPLNGNIYDSGYAPSKYTCCEVCFKFNSTTSDIEWGDGVFGTHQNAYHSYAGNYASNPPSYTYDNSKDNNGWGNGNGRNNVQWKTNTNYHWVMSDTQLGFRYGGTAVQGDGTIQLNTSDNSYHNNSYNTDVYDSIILLSNSDLSHPNKLTNFTFNIECNFESGGNKIQGKYFTLCVTKDRWGIGSGVGQQIANNCFEWCWNHLKDVSNPNPPYTYHNGTKYNLASKNEGGLFDDNNTSYNAWANIQKNKNVYSSTEIGGNLWIGGVNFNDSSSSNAVNPNPMSSMDNTLIGRNHITWNTYSNPNTRPSSIPFSTDLNISCFKTPNVEWVYVIIYDYDDNQQDGIARDSNNKRKKFLYVPRETEIADSNNTGKYYIAFWKYDTNADGTWSSTPCEVIYPFQYKQPS